MRSLSLTLVLAVAGLMQMPAQQGQGRRGGAQGAKPAAAGQQAPGEEGRAGRDPVAAAASGLRFRSIGPAMISGRINSIAVDPTNHAHYFVGVASGGVWRTTNNGTTFTPVFDREGSYSIGAMTIDPKNPAVVWVGTGENNSQRSVSYGDGVYKSTDYGRTWRNMGLNKSEHIGRIAIDPRNSDVVYVAAQGPLWGPGGDRGLYKTTDGGRSWKAVLTVSENTGVNDVVIDPRNPDVLYASSWQRRRHNWTLIDGGPESALYKSTDAGANWTRLRGGLPTGDLGRIGLAISPADPTIIYAIVAAANRQGGIFRSTDAGASWERRNSWDNTAMYYGKIFADPKYPNRIYVMNVNIMVSDDGGTTLMQMPSRSKHVDNHYIWIDPDQNDHYLVGCDGGLYESFDRGETWNFKANLPLAQFYDVDVDNALPFYNVYGGTQDNSSVGGPSRTRNTSGIVNSDWFITTGGDGFRSHTDPQDPNTVYAESQEGGLVRYDRRTGTAVGIAPEVGKGEETTRQNWDTPFIVSPHSHTRLYYAGNRVFRSDNRGDDWKEISGDLTRQLNRDLLPVMGRIWPPEAVEKNASTALYGNASALAESPKKEGLIWVGTDDGLLQVTENGGGAWRKIDTFPGVPERTYVSRILASQFDANTVYVSFDNHQNSDFAPYILKSTDLGKTWTSIKSNLPANGPVLAIAEDFMDPKLLFVGTEFGVFFSNDGGDKWTQLRGGLPTIAVRDIVIQKRENDLVLATFGRGFYILDDYSPLRSLKQDTLDKPGVIFPVKDALMFPQYSPIGGGKGHFGESYFTAENPPYGATFTYYLKEAPRTKRQLRQEAERAAARAGEQIKYPTPEELRAEQEEQPPQVVLTVTDSAGKVVRRITAPAAAGLHRATWDFRYPAATMPPPAVTATGGRGGFGGGFGGAAAPAEPPAGFRRGGGGMLAMPGKYSVSLAMQFNGTVTPLAGPVAFNVVADSTLNMTPADRKALVEFQQKVQNLQRAISAALEVANTTKGRIGQIRAALADAPESTPKLIGEFNALDKRMDEILMAFRGGRSLSLTPPPSIQQRLQGIAGELRNASAPPTQTAQEQYNIAAQEFKVELGKLRTITGADLPKLEKAAAAAGIPWIPGQLPDWTDK
jgi:photosystem II stability/assembly factor-like uncharacterized protein